MDLLQEAIITLEIVVTEPDGQTTTYIVEAEEVADG